MNESVSDEALMQRYGAGDMRAFETLYERHKGPLYRYLLRMTGTAVAEEFFQDVWMKVIRARGEYEVRAKFTTWLYRLAHNRVIDHYRRTRVAPPMLFDDGEDPLTESVPDVAYREPENELARRRLGERLVTALNELPETQREVFLLREEGDLSLPEIAETIGITLEAAKSRLRYAILKLRDRLAESDDATYERRKQSP